MKKALFLLSLVCISCSLGAQTIYVDVGHAPDASSSVFLGMISLEGNGFIAPGVSIGTFSRNGRSVLWGDVHLASVLRRGSWFAESNLGIGRIDSTTDRLGTHLQFRSALFLGFRRTSTSFRCGWQHISNGSRLFGLHGPNAGENFVTCGLGVTW